MEASNYRPICLLSTINKVFEKLLEKRLLDDIQQHGGLSQQQHGFRRGRSCFTALTVFTDYVYKSIDSRCGKVLALFIDFKKAFDKVPHDKLIQVLRNRFNVNAHIINLLISYLSERKYSFRLGNQISDEYDFNCGISQGSVLGPLNFICYIDEICDHFRDINYLLYADDLVIMLNGTNTSQLETRMNSILVGLNEWLSVRSIELSTIKTKVMLLHKEHDAASNNLVNIVYNGIEIEQVYEFKYLGVIIDSTLQFKLHYERVCKKVSQAIGILNKLKRFITFRIFIIMLNAYIISIVDYCLPIWGCVNDSDIDYLQRKIERCIRGFINTSKVKDPVDVIEATNLLTIRERCLHASAMFIFKLLKHGSDVQYIIDMFPKVTAGRTRASQSNSIRATHKPKSSCYFRSFGFRIITFWNSIPLLTDAKNLTVFDCILSSHLIRNYRNS